MSATNWIADGEKYALVGLSIKVSDCVATGKIGRNLWLYMDNSFDLPDHWREWLGTIRSHELASCNVFLLAKAASSTVDVLDGENQRVQHLASTFYTGLQLTSRFAPAHRPFVLTGSRCGATLDVRQQLDFERPAPCIFRHYPEVFATDFVKAAHLAEAIDNIPAVSILGGHWRLFRAISVYLKARTNQDMLERLHQYSRCIEGIIGADAGHAKRQFKSRTELFIGPQHHDLMGEIYDIRSAVEHLHEDRYILNVGRKDRLELIKKEAVIEGLARRVLSTIISNSQLWPHFANRAAIEKFWGLDARQQTALWGSPFDLEEPLVDFEPKHINDGQLGLS